MFKFRLHTVETICECYGRDQLMIYDDNRIYLNNKNQSRLSIAPEMLGKTYEIPRIPSDLERFIVRDLNQNWAIEDWMVDEILEESNDER